MIIAYISVVLVRIELNTCLKLDLGLMFESGIIHLRTESSDTYMQLYNNMNQIPRFVFTV